MKVRVNVTCPYCGHQQPAAVEFADHTTYTRPQVVVCDPDEGGCDRYYVFDVRATFAITTGTIGGNFQQPVVAQPEAPAIVGPDWSKAPGWAQWWAVDENGSAWWYAVEPRKGECTWFVDDCDDTVFADFVDLDGGHWYRSLTKRP